MNTLNTVLAAAALIAGPGYAAAASVSLAPAAQTVNLSAHTATFDVVMDFGANEATVGGGIDLSVTGPATLTGFTPSTYFTGTADPAFTGFGTANADHALEIHLGSFAGLSGTHTLGTLGFDLNTDGTTQLGLSVNSFYGGFFSVAGAAQSVDLRGATLTVTPIEGPPVPGIPEPQTWAFLLAGLAGLGAWTRRQRRAD